jgi:putative NIF3 family GTP cyclohydrolase 1 type 2
MEQVTETRLEMIVPVFRLDAVLQAMRSAHPYEEVAFDVYPLENHNAGYGAGAIGTLPRRMSLRRFLGLIQRTLGSRHPRYGGNPETEVQSIAVCGGSGGELLPDAIAAGADVLVTADLRYHVYAEARGRIAIVDAGHFETEWPVVGRLAAFVREACRRRNEHIVVMTSQSSKNPVATV